MGVSLGREGAPKQAGAVLGNLFATGAGLSDEQRRLLVACGAGAGMSASMMIAEFAKEAAISLISAFLLAQAMLAGYIARAGFVALIGLAAAMTTNVSYLVWYGFPASYTLAYGFIDFMGYVVAGLVIAAPPSWGRS